MIFPQLIAPSSFSLGNTAQRAAAVSFVALADIAAFSPLPKAIGVGVTITSDTIDVRGFNVFFAIAACSGANLSFRINELDPATFALILTRTIGGVTAGIGNVGLPAGFGNATALGGNDVFHYITISMVNVGAAPATLDVFPGFWCTVR